MTYTIEELEAFINDGTLQLRSDGITHLALTLASQLLDTMREAARRWNGTQHNLITANALTLI
mgnify:CR=1 FL=1